MASTTAEIHHLHWNIQTPNGTGEDWEHTLANQLPEALDRTLTSLLDTMPEQGNWVVDHLHLSLGAIPAPWTLTQWEEALSQALRSALREAQPAAKGADWETEPTLPKSKPQTSHYQAYSEPERQAAILEHYLTLGRLPWWQTETVDLPQLQRWWTQLEASPAPNWVLPGLARPHFRTRLAYQFPQRDIWQILAMLWPELLPKDILKALEAAFPSHQPLAPELLADGLYEISQVNIHTSPLGWVQPWVQSLRRTPTGQTALKQLQQALRSGHSVPVLSIALRNLTNPQVTQSAHLSRSTVLRADKDSANTSTTDSQQEKVPGEASMQRVTEKGSPVTDSSSRFTPTESPEGLWVDHAGIVLLWPFFSRLFETQGWLREESFISSHAQASAMVLLYWLATGEDNPSEAQLLLQKWLVGWPLDEPLLHLTTPQEAAKQEGEKVLLVTLEYWTKMNNSSPEGLRQAYLQRPGQLSAGHPSWTLALESATHDVLLDFLPWGLGVVRLPWLSQTLEIQW